MKIYLLKSKILKKKFTKRKSKVPHHKSQKRENGILKTKQKQPTTLTGTARETNNKNK